MRTMMQHSTPMAVGPLPVHSHGMTDTGAAQRHAAALGGAIREARQRLGMAQSDVDLAVGLKPGNCHRWEKGLVLPKAETMARVIAHLGMPLDRASVLYMRAWMAKQGIATAEDAAAEAVEAAFDDLPAEG